MRTLTLVCLALIAVLPLRAQESCRTIHGRASITGGDFNLRVWHIGTHHEYEPVGDSDAMVIGWLADGAKKLGITEDERALPASAVLMFGDFVVCPVEPLKQGAVQKAIVKSVAHRRYVPWD
jgi:hypothetical protein